MKYKNKYEIVSAMTFADLVAHGESQPNTSLVDGYPESFYYNEQPIAYENSTTYLIANDGDTLKMRTDDILITPKIGKMFLLNRWDFEKLYSQE